MKPSALLPTLALISSTTALSKPRAIGENLDAARLDTARLDPIRVDAAHLDKKDDGENVDGVNLDGVNLDSARLDKKDDDELSGDNEGRLDKRDAKVPMFVGAAASARAELGFFYAGALAIGVAALIL